MGGSDSGRRMHEPTSAAPSIASDQNVERQPSWHGRESRRPGPEGGDRAHHCHVLGDVLPALGLEDIRGIACPIMMAVAEVMPWTTRGKIITSTLGARAVTMEETGTSSDRISAACCVHKRRQWAEDELKRGKGRLVVEIVSMTMPVWRPSPLQLMAGTGCRSP